MWLSGQFNLHRKLYAASRNLIPVKAKTCCGPTSGEANLSPAKEKTSKECSAPLNQTAACASVQEKSVSSCCAPPAAGGGCFSVIPAHFNANEWAGT